MKTRYYIPVCLFILVQSIYDLFGTIQSTNWSIFYYSGQYFAWLVLIFLIPNSIGVKKIPKFVMGISLMVYIVIELSKIGKDYLTYYSEVNSFQTSILPIAVLITGLTIFIIKIWQR